MLFTNTVWYWMFPANSPCTAYLPTILVYLSKKRNLQHGNKNNTTSNPYLSTPTSKGNMLVARRVQWLLYLEPVNVLYFWAKRKTSKERIPTPVKTRVIWGLKVCIYIYQHPQRGANWILKFKTYKGCPLDTPYKQQVLYTNIIHNPVPSPFYPTNRFRLDPPHVLLRPSSRSRLLSGQVGRNEGMTGEARALGGNQNLTYD